MKRYVVGVSGASGAILGVKTMQALILSGHKVHLTLSKAALMTASYELGKKFASPSHWKSLIPEEYEEKLSIEADTNFACQVATGSYKTDGMIIVPCSMATLAAVAFGISDNTLRRAADVTLKEKRQLILVPREAPFSTLHLENMLKLSKLGATILPPVPAWYTKQEKIGEVEDGMVGKILSLLGLDDLSLSPVWKAQRQENPRIKRLFVAKKENDE